VSDDGLARSRVIRRLAKLGPQRLARWDDRVNASAPLRVALAPARRWLDAGPLIVPTGPAEGIRLSKADLPLRHAHIGGLAFGELEVPVQEALRRHVAPGATFFDVGANVGFFSLLAARLAGPEGHVVAFEPVPESAAAIRRNAALNSFANVTVREQAAGAAAGRERFEVVVDASWSHMAARGEHPGAVAHLDVEVVVLDDLVAAGEVPAPHVIKLDVEGSELDVLQGLRATLRDHRPALICELHDTHAEFAALIGELGYVASNLEGTDPLGVSSAAHWLAVPA
jgi:FkbM family methyltransferase